MDQQLCPLLLERLRRKGEVVEIADRSSLQHTLEVLGTVCLQLQMVLRTLEAQEAMPSPLRMAA